MHTPATPDTPAADPCGGEQSPAGPVSGRTEWTLLDKIVQMLAIPV